MRIIWIAVVVGLVMMGDGRQFAWACGAGGGDGGGGGASDGDGGGSGGGSGDGAASDGTAGGSRSTGDEPATFEPYLPRTVILTDGYPQ